MAQCTWEPISNLTFVTQMVQEFDRNRDQNSRDNHKTHKIRKLSSKEPSSSEQISRENDKKSVKKAKSKIDKSEKQKKPVSAMLEPDLSFEIKEDMAV